MSEKLVMVNECPKCGGEVEEGAQGQKYIYCPFCRTKFLNPNADVKDQAGNTKPKDFPYFDPSIFEEKWEYPMIRSNQRAFEMVTEMSECLSKYGSSKEILDYIFEELSSDPDFAAEGINEKLLHKVEKNVSGQLEPGEKIIYFVDAAILFHGKAGFVITDRRIIFGGNKWRTSQRYDRLYQIRIDCTDNPCIYFNKITDVWLANAGASVFLQGATTALIIRFALEQKKESEKITFFSFADEDYDDDDEDEDEED